ncbi:MAG: hypothetical protein PHY70_02615, partial [Methanocellales archaeon]|nr:hypothetical protein [Methanocellales archaeon]
MAVGRYSKTEKDRFEKYLKLAKDIVQNFPNINKIVNNFDYLETSASTDNLLVRLFVSTKYDIWGEPNQELSILKQIEEGLSLMDVFNLPKRKRSRIFSRLKSNKSEQVLSVISEIELASYFIKKIGKENVTIEPVLSNGRPELKLNLNGRVIYIEQTNVDRGTVERKLEYIFTKA